MLIGISGKIGSGKDTVGKIIQYLTAKNEAILDINMPDRDYWINISFEDYFKYNMLVHKWQIKKFADKLKDIVCILLGCTIEQLENREFKEQELGEEWDRIISSDGKVYLPDEYPDLEYSKLTPRLLLQLLGTECGREIIHPNIWVNALMSEYKVEVIPNENYRSNKTKPKNWVITREEEYEYLLDNSHWVYKEEVNVISPNWIITDLRFPNELEAVKKRGGITIRVNRRIKGFPSDHPSETALDNAKFDYIINNNGTIEELIEKVREILIKEKII